MDNILVVDLGLPATSPRWAWPDTPSFFFLVSCKNPYVIVSLAGLREGIKKKEGLNLKWDDHHQQQSRLLVRPSATDSLFAPVPQSQLPLAEYYYYRRTPLQIIIIIEEKKIKKWETHRQLKPFSSLLLGIESPTIIAPVHATPSSSSISCDF